MTREITVTRKEPQKDFDYFYFDSNKSLGLERLSSLESSTGSINANFRKIIGASAVELITNQVELALEVSKANQVVTDRSRRCPAGQFLPDGGLKNDTFCWSPGNGGGIGDRKVFGDGGLEEFQATVVDKQVFRKGAVLELQACSGGVEFPSIDISQENRGAINNQNLAGGNIIETHV